MMRSVSTMMLTVALLCGCDSAAALVGGEPELGVPISTVERGSVTQTILLTGELEAENAVQLLTPRTENWQISVKWLAEDGAIVKKGDRVVEFDNSSVIEKLGNLEVKVVEAGVELETQQAETAVQVADKQFEVESQETAVAKAKLDATVPAELVSRREAQDFKIALQRAEVARTTATRDLDSLRGGGRLDEQVKRVAYDKAMRAYKAAGEELDALALTAPRDGIVLVGKEPREGRKLQIGDNVWPGLVVAELPDLSKTLVKATLSDVDDRRVVGGMKVTCTVDAFPDVPLSGFVRSVSAVAQRPSRESTRQAFSVVVELDDDLTEQMRPGLSVKVEVPSEVLVDALLVPRAALSFSAEGAASVLLEDGREVDVKVGACDAQRCAALSGLSEDDRVRMPGGAA
ncbi:MAG: HlyD family efflux transporter periplasmic adaptor subunit [Nannocystaceae bacterium]|nr:HlyD family efflux transporter periplasmic adaptor subunit [Nannocystaceae bacterium]